MGQRAGTKRTDRGLPHKLLSATMPHHTESRQPLLCSLAATCTQDEEERPFETAGRHQAHICTDRGLPHKSTTVSHDTLSH
jgi:hypothetical protein